MQRKHKSLKLGGGQAYDFSSDWTVVITQGRIDTAYSALQTMDWHET
jgi:hypothetical protein